MLSRCWSSLHRKHRKRCFVALLGDAIQKKNPIISLCTTSCFGLCSESVSRLLPLSQKTLVEAEKGQEVLKLSPLPKRAKRTYLAIDKDKEVIGYVIPVFRAE